MTTQKNDKTPVGHGKDKVQLGTGDKATKPVDSELKNSNANSRPDPAKSR